MSAAQPEQIELHHDEAGSRYVLTSSGETVGLVEYRREGDVLELTHTEVVPQGRDRGIGTVLVREVLDDIRSKGHQIVPSCDFVARFLEGHDGYGDLVAG